MLRPTDTRVIFRFASTIVLTACLHAHGQTISNPSFEFPGPNIPFFQIIRPGESIGGWSVHGAGVDYFDSSSPIVASDGQFFVDLVRGAGQVGEVRNTINGLTPGRAHTLRFDGLFGASGPGNGILVDIGSGLAGGFFSTTSLGVWLPYEVHFVPTTTSLPLSFSAGPNPIDLGVLLDNVRVIVPEPASLTFTGLSILAVLAPRRLFRA